MSLGGGVMILGERITDQRGGPVLFMLALLEVGTVAILLALLLMGTHAGSFSFADLAAAHAWHSPASLLIGLLLLFGFGAKLGVLPFYEWFPAAYGAGSGATGVVFSGIVLNAAFYALARGVLIWLPRSGAWIFSVAIIMTIAGVLSAILAIFNAFQEEDWRRMLSLSSASLAFSNALRTFYGFIYGPTHNLEREYDHGPYFVKRLIFNQEVAPIFGPFLSAPITRLVKSVADKVSGLQSGYLNFYNALIGMLLVLILALTLFYK
jgi:hypothetical protein